MMQVIIFVNIRCVCSDLRRLHCVVPTTLQDRSCRRHIMHIYQRWAKSNHDSIQLHSKSHRRFDSNI